MPGLEPWTCAAHSAAHKSCFRTAAWTAELAGAEHLWAELLDGSHGLHASSLCVLFAGPHVPEKLDGQNRVGCGGALRMCFLRGLWHEARHRTPSDLPPPQIALAFNSGLAEHAAGWLPTLQALYFGLRLPLAFTSYHQPEAELDARTLAVRLGVKVKRMDCMPNPFVSKLPHLDTIALGRTYRANGFLSVCKP